jgi:hypothetical protein
VSCGVTEGDQGGDSPELSGGAARELDSGGGRRPTDGKSREVGSRRSEWGTEEVGFG